MKQGNRNKLISRTNRIEGQIVGIGRMIEDDRCCVEIIDQIAAARSAHSSLGIELLRSHVES